MAFDPLYLLLILPGLLLSGWASARTRSHRIVDRLHGDAGRADAGLASAVWIYALIFSAVILFQVVTLPVEFDASARAKALLIEHSLVTSAEREGVDAVLNAAALTYVAAAVSSLATLAYFPDSCRGPAAAHRLTPARSG